MEKQTSPLLQMEEISKDFEGVHALSGVNFEVSPGEFHALVGENGAGKSTLMKIISGVYPDGMYQGKMVFNGEICHFNKTRDAQQKGIAIIHQELNLVSTMTVAENIFLGHEPNHWGWVDQARMRMESDRILKRLGVDFRAETKVSDLSVGQSQMTEIAKALAQDVTLLILDEPTSALTEREIQSLFSLLRQLQSEGVTIIYISHKLEEVFALSDRITVLRDGTVIGTWITKETSPQKIVSAMVGRDITDMYPWEAREQGEVILEVENLSVFQNGAARHLIKDVSFSIREGEILGMAGLMGSGRTEVALSLFGCAPGRASGTIRIHGESQAIDSPQTALSHGLALLTEDRKQSGLFFNLSILKNITLASLDKVSVGPFVKTGEERHLGEDYSRRLTVKTADLQNLVGTLSGGNQQKVLLARWLATNPKVLILDEPTRGIDVGAKVEIYRLMIELAQQGLAILMISSELPEILGMSDRILVMRRGEVAGTLTREEASEERIMQLATGVGALV